MIKNVALKITVNSTGESVTFAASEVPEKITIGGKQMLKTHKFVGGLRVIDAMGADDMPLMWSGLFFGSDATYRMSLLDGIRRSGALCTVNWDVFQYTAVIANFEADFERSNKIPYRISLEVAQDETRTIEKPSTTSPTTALNQDSATMTQLANTIGISSISSQASSVSSALNSVTNAAQPIANGLVSLTAPALGPQIGQISTLSSAANSAILAAEAPLAALQSSVHAQIAIDEAILAGVPTLGFINPSLPMPAQITALVNQSASSTRLTSLYTLSAVVARMTDNLTLVANPSGNNKVVTGGGNLYQLASKQYGDATRWTDIAQASGLSDPMTPGFANIVIPQ